MLLVDIAMLLTVVVRCKGVAALSAANNVRMRTHHDDEVKETEEAFEARCEFEEDY